MLGLWAASEAPQIIPDGGGRSPPPSGLVLGAARAAQTAKIDDLRPAKKPYAFIGFGAMDVTKPYEFIGLGPWMSPNPMNL